jgi:hypothetical protein
VINNDFLTGDTPTVSSINIAESKIDPVLEPTTLFLYILGDYIA